MPFSARVLASVGVSSFSKPWAGNAMGAPSHTPNTNSSFSPCNQPGMGWVSGLPVSGYDSQWVSELISPSQVGDLQPISAAQ